MTSHRVPLPFVTPVCVRMLKMVVVSALVMVVVGVEVSPGRPSPIDLWRASRVPPLLTTFFSSMTGSAANETIRSAYNRNENTQESCIYREQQRSLEG